MRTAGNTSPTPWEDEGQGEVMLVGNVVQRSLRRDMSDNNKPSAAIVQGCGSPVKGYVTLSS